jgi:hypothetical protein
VHEKYVAGPLQVMSSPAHPNWFSASDTPLACPWVVHVVHEKPVTPVMLPLPVQVVAVAVTGKVELPTFKVVVLIKNE